MGYIVFLAIFSALTSILGLAYISLSEQSKTDLKEFLNNV